MDYFIGVKIIQAEPAQRDGIDGFNVIYPDGYKSWSPRNQFEAAYLKLGVDPTKITAAEIESIIAEVDVERIDPKTTLVRCQTVTGFVQYKTSSCVDSINYDEEIGKKVGMKKIQDDLWFAMGFVLQWARYGLKYVSKTVEESGSGI